MATAKKRLDELRSSVTATATQDFEDDLTWRSENIKRRLDSIDTTVTQLKKEMAEITLLNEALLSRKADVDRYRAKADRIWEQMRDIESETQSR